MVARLVEADQRLQVSCRNDSVVFRVQFQQLLDALCIFARLIANADAQRLKFSEAIPNTTSEVV
jgi:hypothetical protein